MRTNINIDDELIRKGFQYTGIHTKKKLVEFALKELVKREEQKEILKLKGKLQWEGNLEEMRQSRFDNLG